MKLLLFVILLTGCAASMKELIVEAKECVAHSVNEQGVIGATPEQRTACWAPVNDKIAAKERAAELREKRQGPSCGGRLVAWCDWKGCQCVSSRDVQDALRRARL